MNYIIGPDMKAQMKILDGNVLYTKWAEGKIELHEVKAIMEEMLNLMSQHSIIRYIDDISKCIVDWKEADKWIVNDWYERALKLGVVKNALIVSPPENMQHVDEQCEIKSFNSFDDALNWVSN